MPAKKPETEKKRPLAVIILAAGLGKRMHSDLPKVLHEAAGLPLLFHSLLRVQEADAGAEISIVVGHGRDKVEAAVRAFKDFSQDKISFCIQPEQLGTGHAARCAMDSAWGKKRVDERANILILPGDSPLMTAELVRAIGEPLGRETLRLLTTRMPDPTGYGRVVRRGKAVKRIVEERDASVTEKRIGEVATSVYLFESRFLTSALAGLSNKNSQKEYYLTDLVALAARKGGVAVLEWACADDVRGVNDPWELAQSSQILNERILKEWSKRGVKFLDPRSTWVDAQTVLSPGVVVHPGALLRGTTHVAENVTIGPRAVLTRTRVGTRAAIKVGTVCEDSEIGAGAQVGPYAHLRPDSHVGPEAKIGNFVELKKTRVGEKTSIAHLSYLGDAEVGRNVNIGCGFVTCNFDGRVIDGERKHKTIIEDGVFLGSDCQTVAPVRVGRGAYVASGSTITEDVQAEALAIARSRQVNKPGYARKLKGN